MNNLPVDLNLLVLFDAVLRHRSVSRAAEAVGLSQPAVSNGLRRLREHFHDRLFVRTAEGMMPTPAAEALGGTVSAALAQLGAGLARRRAFDPGAETRTFTLIVTDIGEIVFLPRLLDTARRDAPRVSFRTVHLPAAATQRALESGDADLAVGFVPDLTAGVFQQRLFATEYVCMARSDHPAIGDRVTRAQFMGATHAVADAEGTGHYVVAQALARLKPAPRIGPRPAVPRAAPDRRRERHGRDRAAAARARAAPGGEREAARAPAQAAAHRDPAVLARAVPRRPREPVAPRDAGPPLQGRAVDLECKRQRLTA